MEQQNIHKFERAGLGKAPFRFVGLYEDRGPRKTYLPGGIVVEVGAEGQPMGVCKYCGTGIAICCKVRSADGKEFVVGSDCIEKVGDKGLVKTIKRSPEFRAHQRKLRQNLDERKTKELNDLLAANEDKLRSMTFIYTDWNGVKHERNQFDWISNSLKFCGAAGRARNLKFVKKLISEGTV